MVCDRENTKEARRSLKRRLNSETIYSQIAERRFEESSEALRKNDYSKCESSGPFLEPGTRLLCLTATLAEANTSWKEVQGRKRRGELLTTVEPRGYKNKNKIKFETITNENTVNHSCTQGTRTALSW